MNPICTATTVSGRPCKAQVSQWPQGVDGNPQLCGRHLPVDLREIRDAGFVELERRRVEFRGQTRVLVEWCEVLGLSYGAVRQRLHNGWPIERALTTGADREALAWLDEVDAPERSA